MYTTSAKFSSAIKNNARYISAYYLYRGLKHDIRKLDIDDNIYTNDNFIGTFIAKNGTITVNVGELLPLEDKEIDVYIGLKLADSVEYVPMGTYRVYECSNKNEYKIIDYRYKFNTKFDSAKVEFPTTPLNLLRKACLQAGVDLTTTDFPNKDIFVPASVFFGYKTTCADIVLAVAQASCSFAKITRDNKLALKWFNEVDFDIDYDHQKNKTENDLTKSINTIVLAREPQNDNVYYPEVVVGDRVEFKIVNNPILDEDRYTSVLPIYERLNGFNYLPLTIQTQGYFHLDSGDILRLQQQDGTYLDVLVMNHSISYSGGVASSFETPALTKTQINYKMSSAIKNKILNAELQVDKVKGEIKAIATEQEGMNTQIGQLNIKTDQIKADVTNVDTSVYKFETGKGNIFENCNQRIEKNSTSTAEVISVDMPLGISADYLTNRDICISCEVIATNAVIGNLKGYMGAEFTVNYADNTNQKIATWFVPGLYGLEHYNDNGISSIGQRIYTQYKIANKPLTSVSNLKIIISLNGDYLSVTKPKVEFGLYPTGFEFDMQEVRDNITTVETNFTSMEQKIDYISLQAVSTTEKITTIKGDVESLTTRVNSTELKLTPTEITAMVNEKIGDDGQLKTTKVMINNAGLNVYGGGIAIYNNADEKVFFADNLGNLKLTADITTPKATINSDGLSIYNGGISIYNNNNNKVFYADGNGNLTLTAHITYAQIDGANINISQDARIGNILYLGDKTKPNEYRCISMNGGDIQYETSGEVIFFKSGQLGMHASTFCSIGVGPGVGGGGINIEMGANPIINLNASKVYSTVAITVTSDERRKNSIQDIDVSWVDELEVKEFEYNNCKDVKQIGLIAQRYVNKPYAKYFLDCDDKGYYAITYQNITNALIKYTQQLKKELIEVKTQVSLLQKGSIIDETKK